jgi:SAM-dependent methyltransferase
VVGLDPFQPAVEYATEHYAGLNLSFQVGLLVEVALDAGSFDLAVAFEVIEHVEDPVGFADHVRRLLRPDGRAIFSTPHRPVSAPNGGVSDPTHLREFDSVELTHVLMQAGFSEVQLLGQHIGAGMWRRHSTRAMLGRLDFLGLRRLLPASAKARVIVAASSIGATQADRTSARSSITDELEGAYVQIAICRP